MNIANLPNGTTLHPGDLEDLNRPIVTLAQDLPGPGRFPYHQHARAQLVYASAGVLTVETAQSTWVVPPQQAVWVPADTHHEVRWSAAASMRSLYVNSHAILGLPQSCGVVSIGPFLRQLILEAVGLPNDYGPDGPEIRLMLVILDQLIKLKLASLYLPLPGDQRLKPVTDSLLEEPGDDRDFDQWAVQAALSPRTLARLFRKETGMSFGAWRKQLRLLKAIDLLGAGQPVTSVSYDLGYQSPSAFIAMFKRALGEPPGRYFRARPEG